MESARRVLSPWRDRLVEPLGRDHMVQFYGDDESVEAAFATFVAAGLNRGESAVLVATPEHAEAVRSRLSREGLQTVDLERWGQLRILDARAVLEELLVGGALDQDRFQSLSRVLISDARQASRNGRVRLSGEMVNLLWSRGQVAEAMQLERLWSETIAADAVPLFCAYRIGDGVPPATLCEVHTHLVPFEAFA